jgi:predicted Na+-dependent transporter
MNLKRIFGAILTILGIAGLIYAAVLFAGDTAVTKVPVIYGIIGLIFFISGVSLIRTTKDES